MARKFFVPCAFLAAAALAARALTLVLITDAQLVEMSDRIVVGTVLTAQAQWLDPDGDGVQSIYTVATFRIDQVVKGTDQPGALLTLHVFGGTIGNRTMTAPGIPLFQKDERLLLCLTPKIATCKYSPVVGAVQGRWTVRAGDDGRDIARRDFQGASFMSVASDGTVQEAQPPESKDQLLADVVARLQAEMKR